MHEKTLLYSALGVTAIVAAIGVYKAKSDGPRLDIAPVSLIDASKGVAGAEVPVRLTASDGTGLELVALRAEAAVEDPLALTQLHLTFENPEDRVLEGTFRITLPQGASLSRFAMKVGNAWQEGEVVEKQAARQAYEDFLHRKQDPALMEQGAGNEFSARVFPIPARGTKEIIVTYAEAVELGAPYVLPLRGLPELGALDVNVHVSGSQAAIEGGKTDALHELHQQRFTPAGDFVVEGKRIPRSPGLRSGDLAIARVVPFASSRPEPVGAAVVLVDTSASRGLGIAEQARTLQAILAKLPGDAPVTVACFDQEVVPIFTGKAGAFGQREVATIVARGALGASDFELALGWAADEAKKAKASRVILVTDGVATAGETDGQKLKSKVEQLREAGVARMDAVAMGGIRDDGFLRTVVRGVLDRDGVVLDAKLGADALARRLGEATSSGVAVKVEGAKWSWPDKLDGLQAGDEVLVYAELDGADAGTRGVRIDVGGQEIRPDLRTLDRPLVERAWAQAKIQSLVESPVASPAATKQEIIALSTRHRVLSPHTALLVLETDWDYRRFNIDRTANVDILAVQDGRVAVVQGARGWEEERQKAPIAPTPAAKGRSATGGSSRERAEPAAAPAPPAAVATATAAASAAPPSAAWAAEPESVAPGSPAESLADGLGDSFGAGGLGLSGIGEGGGGRGEDRGGLGALGGSAGGSPQGNAEAPVVATAPAVDAPAQPRAVPSPAPRPVTPPRCPSGDPLCADEPAPQPAASRVRRADEAASAGAVRPGTLTIERGIAADEVQRVVRGSVPRLRACYSAELARTPSTGGRLAIRFTLDPSGAVRAADLVEAPGSDTFRGCLSAVAKGLRFSAPGSSDASFTQTFDLVGGDQGVASAPPNQPKALPYEGRFKIVMEALQRGDKEGALVEANRWHADQPGDVLSLVALGEVFEAKGDLKTAARAYGSILELFSFRADSRRFAGERLERLADARALALAVDTYGKAAEQRPDHPASHRLYAFALLKKGEHEKAFEAMRKGAARTYPMGRFRGVDRILKEDLGLVAAAWIHAQPARAGEIRTKLREAGGTEENGPSLRFVLNWETDANDVDFHIRDGKGGHAYYSQTRLPSGGELYADVTTGYGPECFTIRGGREQRAYPYTLQAHYYSRGPMGYGMGKLQVLEHDGNGRLSFEERPFVVMIDRAYVDMGTVDKSTKLADAAAMNP
ncbi:MAG: AgmX/PglI C-terminal domain-containing protein [Labilithrix sp.]|nr:AgmX/PglI C-terminal domain-containing protein [Labilithrix sp.]